MSLGASYEKVYDLLNDKMYHVAPNQRKYVWTNNNWQELLDDIDMASGPNQHRHNGRCNGDYAHCPPHYGYRYGRWYYGRDHVHGCEFGGNRGSGSMD